MFKALSSPTRLKILKILIQEEIHISGLSRKIGISVPVTAKHIKILEKANLINKKIFGNTHILSAKSNKIEEILNPFVKKTQIQTQKNKSIFDALKQIPGIQIEKQGNNRYIKSIDGEEGYYIYEVNGKLPKKPIDKYKISRNISLDIKKLVTLEKRKIKIKIK